MVVIKVAIFEGRWLLYGCYQEPNLSVHQSSELLVCFNTCSTKTSPVKKNYFIKLLFSLFWFITKIKTNVFHTEKKSWYNKINKTSFLPFSPSPWQVISPFLLLICVKLIQTTWSLRFFFYFIFLSQSSFSIFLFLSLK